MRLRREKVALSPVYYTALQSNAVEAGGPMSGISLAASKTPGRGLKDDEPVVSISSIFGSAAEGYSSTAPGHVLLNPQPDVAGAGAGGGAAAADAADDAAGARLGYLRLTSFSQNAAEETKHAIQSLEVCVYVCCWLGNVCVCVCVNGGCGQLADIDDCATLMIVQGTDI